jgi:putative AlgH/UPF0301 family transcriptional regulator
MKRLLGFLLFVLAFFAAVVPARAEVSLDGPVLVVAARELRGAYRGRVLVATPMNGGHIGFVLNHPTPLKLAEVFDDHPPSKAVKDPIYLGGPNSVNALFVMHRGAPGRGGFTLMPGVAVETFAAAIDAIIETRPNEARYYSGYVAWRPGQLAEEVKRGLMTLAPVTVEQLFQPDTAGLYERLAPRKGQLSTRLER